MLALSFTLDCRRRRADRLLHCNDALGASPGPLQLQLHPGMEEDVSPSGRANAAAPPTAWATAAGDFSITTGPFADPLLPRSSARGGGQ